MVNLWRKSRDSVTQITRVIAAICDGYHTRACDSALHRCPLKPRIAPCPLRVPQFILLEAFTPLLPIGIRSDESETSPLNSRMAPAGPVAGHAGDDATARVNDPETGVHEI